MAPKNGRGKTKDKKKKEGKGISTDRIMDVRRLLSVNIMICNITNFSLSHEARGPRLKDMVDVAALRPCVLSLVEEDYKEESAAAHVRRLSDVVACTTCFGPSAIKDSKADKNARDAQNNKTSNKKSSKSNGGNNNKQQPSSPPPPSPQTAPQQQSSSTAATIDGEGEMSSACPKLGSFYEIFSLSHLTPPLQFIRKATRQQDDESFGNDHIFSLEARLCNGKLVPVEASRKGF